MTPQILIDAIVSRDRSAIDTALGQVIDFNQRDHNGDTALKHACLECMGDVVKKLIGLGCNLNVRDRWGEPALSWAAFKDCLEVVAVLKGAGSPLTMWAAAMIGDTSAIQHLHNEGVDVNSKVLGNETALLGAAQKGRTEAASLLLSLGAETEGHDFLGTPLCHAAQSGNVIMAEELLRCGANVNGYGEVGTALVLAAATGRLEMIRLLLDNGANTRARDESGATALMRASETGRDEIAKVLVKCISKSEPVVGHAALDDVDECGASALSFGARRGHKTIVELLLDHRADPNLADENGTTPLIVAAQHGHEKIVSLLLERGSDRLLRNKNGKTAAIVANEHGYSEIVRIISDR